jgi:hypothetical protein
MEVSGTILPMQKGGVASSHLPLLFKLKYLGLYSTQNCLELSHPSQC